MQHQEKLKKQKQVGPLQQRVIDAEAKLSKQQGQLRETEQKQPWSLTKRFAELRKKIWPSPRVSSRIQSVDEDTFSAKEEQESSNGPTRGLGPWFKVVKPQKKGFLKNSLANRCRRNESWSKVVNSLPRVEVLRISRKLSKAAGGSAGAMDLVHCNTSGSYYNLSIRKTRSKSPIFVDGIARLSPRSRHERPHDNTTRQHSSTHRVGALMTHHPG